MARAAAEAAQHPSKKDKLFFLFLLLLCLDIVHCSTNVRSLPGFTGSLPFKLETGYIGVDEAKDVQLFYYFIKSERKPSDDPLILWITGGPGCSSLSGLVYEIGPLHFKAGEYNGTLPQLMLNPSSWTKFSNIIFLDTPVGTGFSYLKNSKGSHIGDTQSAKKVYRFLIKWLINHPEFLANPLYIGGDSNSGLIIPLIALDISNGNKGGYHPRINLKGYLLGNPRTDRKFDENSKIPYAYGMGLISSELYESTKKRCGKEYVNVDPRNLECLKALQAVSKCTSGLRTEQILDPRCPDESPKRREIIEQRQSHDNSRNSLPPPPPNAKLKCRSYVYSLSYHWANDQRVRKALNIPKGRVPEWVMCNRDLPYYSYDVQSSIKYHAILSKRGFRSLIYSGDHDLVVPFLGTEAWIKSLNYSIIDDWRPWLIPGLVAGYTRTYANDMTFATVKGAGHPAPVYRPLESLAMIERWLFQKPL